MVSLSAVEALASEIVADALPWSPSRCRDQRKGERHRADDDRCGRHARAAFLRHARGKGAPELVVPAEMLLVDSVPLLGSGKPDYVAALALAKAKTVAVAAAASKPAARVREISSFPSSALAR